MGATAGGWYWQRLWGCPAMLVKLGADLSVMFGTQLFLRKQFLDPVTNAGLEKAVRARAAAGPAERWNVGKRIRDVAVAPDGTVWLLEDSATGGLIKVTPK